MKRLALIVVAAAAAFYGSLAAPPFERASTAYAQQCTIKGKQVATAEGTLVCDCTVEKEPNCGCVITCDKGRPPVLEP